MKRAFYTPTTTKKLGNIIIQGKVLEHVNMDREYSQ